MNHLKKGIFAIILLISHICIAQISDDWMLYRKDFKDIAGKNTVSVTSLNGPSMIVPKGIVKV